MLKYHFWSYVTDAKSPCFTHFSYCFILIKFNLYVNAHEASLLKFIPISNFPRGLKKWNPRVPLTVLVCLNRSSRKMLFLTLHMFCVVRLMTLIKGIFSWPCVTISFTVLIWSCRGLCFASFPMQLIASQFFLLCHHMVTCGKKGPRNINTKIIFVHAQITKILTIFILCSTAIQEIFNLFYCLCMGISFLRTPQVWMILLHIQMAHHAANHQKDSRSSNYCTWFVFFVSIIAWYCRVNSKVVMWPLTTLYFILVAEGVIFPKIEQYQCWSYFQLFLSFL